MNTLENAKAMSRQEVIQKTASEGIQEYGAYNDLISEKWKMILKISEREAPLKVIAALNNNDTDKILLELLKTDRDKVLEGIAITAYALDAKELELCLPEGEESLKAELETQAQKYGIKVYCSFLDVREIQCDAVHHIETMAAISDAFGEGYKKDIYIAVKKGDSLGDLQKIAFGTKIADIVQTSREEVKAIQIGTKLYDTSALDMVLDEKIPVHNGIITVIGKDTCMMQEGRKRTYDILMQGCGKCTFCREGLIQFHTMYKEITEGKGKNEFLPMFSEIGEPMSFSTLCSVGQTGSDYVLGSLKYFLEEYTEHLKKKNCPASVCTSFQTIYIDPKACTGCEECADVCPEDCIEGKAGYIHMIDEFDCTKCGKCIEVCEEDAVIRTTGRVPKLPSRLTKCGKFTR